MMLAEKPYVVKADYILRRPDRKPVGLQAIKAERPTSYKLEDRPLVINGKVVV